MFTSPTPSEYSILECPPISSLLMNHKIPATKWNCNNMNNMEIAPNCPRCASSNTKFCYYNNYSLSQPRYFCKGCRRYWTKGGSLRNVPVGGGCRKSRRARAAARRSGAQNHLTPSFSPVSAGSVKESESSTDIDMAAVFARYVNQNVDDNKESSSPGDSSGSSENFSCQLEDGMMFEYPKEVDFHDQIQEVLVPHDDHEISMHEEINGQDFVYQEDSSVFGMQQGILGDDELTADHMLWSEGQDLPNFGSDNGSTVQIEDFGLFSPDDELSISANLVADNWGSFDLSAYEFYSRP